MFDCLDDKLGIPKLSQRQADCIKYASYPILHELKLTITDVIVLIQKRGSLIDVDIIDEIGGMPELSEEGKDFIRYRANWLCHELERLKIDVDIIIGKYGTYQPEIRVLDVSGQYFSKLVRK